MEKYLSVKKHEKKKGRIVLILLRIIFHEVIFEIIQYFVYNNLDFVLHMYVHLYYKTLILLSCSGHKQFCHGPNKIF